jgi:hypothetical protein
MQTRALRRQKECKILIGPQDIPARLLKIHLMALVEDFIAAQDDPQRELMEFLHRLLCIELGLQDKMRYQLPFYYCRSWVCYMNPTRGGGVEFAFLRGNELSNSQGLLESKGRKQVMSVEWNSIADIPLRSLHELMQEALLLDETQPYASKRTKK